MDSEERTQNLSRRTLRRRREKEQRSEEILHSAETLFAGKGYHATSMEEIADLAEVSVGTVYFYFRNKEDLLIKLLDRISLHIRNLVGNEFRGADASLQAFERAGQAFFKNFCLKYPDKLFILVRESVGQGSAVEERRRLIFDKLIADIADALSRVSVNMDVTYRSSLSAEVMAVITVGMFERIAYQYLISQNRVKELTIVADDALLFIMGGVSNLIAGG